MAEYSDRDRAQSGHEVVLLYADLRWGRAHDCRLARPGRVSPGSLDGRTNFWYAGFEPTGAGGAPAPSRPAQPRPTPVRCCNGPHGGPCSAMPQARGYRRGRGSPHPGQPGRWPDRGLRRDGPRRRRCAAVDPDPGAGRNAQCRAGARRPGRMRTRQRGPPPPSGIAPARAGGQRPSPGRLVAALAAARRQFGTLRPATSSGQDGPAVQHAVSSGIAVDGHGSVTAARHDGRPSNPLTN